MNMNKYFTGLRSQATPNIPNTMTLLRDSFVFSSCTFFKVKSSIKPNTKILNTANAWCGFTANYDGMRVRLVTLLRGSQINVISIANVVKAVLHSQYSMMLSGIYVRPK